MDTRMYGFGRCTSVTRHSNPPPWKRTPALLLEMHPLASRRLSDGCGTFALGPAGSAMLLLTTYVDIKIIKTVRGPRT